MRTRAVLMAAAAAVLASPLSAGTEELQERAFREELKTVPYRLVFESNRAGNWDIWIVNADGTGLTNLTNTPDMDEIHAMASPDGRRVYFIGDRITEGRGRRRTIERASYIMNLDGTGRAKIGDNLQNGCWNRDGTALLLVRSTPATIREQSEYDTDDLLIYNLSTGELRSVRPRFFQGLFALAWSPDDQWILFAHHGRMRFGYQILLTDVKGEYVYSVKNYGCRPDFCPDDSKRVAWNTSDTDIAVGVLDTSVLKPGRRDPIEMTNLCPVAHVDKGKVYYVDWSPDAKYLAYARSDDPDPNTGWSFKEKGGWRIMVTRAGDLNPQRVPLSVAVTQPPPNCDDKEPDWVPLPKPGATSGAASRQSRTHVRPIDAALADFRARVDRPVVQN
jgi:Tol biopolymer transport system component